MKTSENINELAKALAAAQGEIKNAHLNKTNPHFKSRYADLAAIRDAVMPALAKNQIAVFQGTGIGVESQRLCLSTRLVHSSGQWVEINYPLLDDPTKPQIMGSALTYARRYSLAAICGIAAEEDDDANAAQSNGNGKLEKPTLPKARARAPYDNIEKAIEAHSNLTLLEQWWDKDTEHKKQPIDWQALLFAKMVKHGFAIAESAGARRDFFERQEAKIMRIPDDEDETRVDVIKTYHELQNGQLTPMDAG
jgi:hypothetical protein